MTWMGCGMYLICVSYDEAVGGDVCTVSGGMCTVVWVCYLRKNSYFLGQDDEEEDSKEIQMVAISSKLFICGFFSSIRWFFP